MAIQLPIGNAENFAGIIDLVTMQAVYFDGDDGAVIRRESIPDDLIGPAQSARTRMLESLAFLDDRMMETVGGDEQPSASEIKRVLRAAIGALSCRCQTTFHREAAAVMD